MSNTAARDVVAAKLPKNWSQDKRDAVADEILADLEEAGHLTIDGECGLIGVGRVLTPVQTIEAYGLEIALDAMGEASEIASAQGLVILG